MPSITEMFAEAFTPVQLLAWLAATIVIISFQMQTGRNTIKLWLPADVLMVLHFYFLGVPFLAMIASGSIIRTTLTLLSTRKILLIYIRAYTVFIATMCFTFFFNWINVMALIGTCFMSASIYFNERFILHRGFAICHQTSWLAVFFTIRSYGGFTLLCGMLISNLIGMTRFIIKTAKSNHINEN